MAQIKGIKVTIVDNTYKNNPLKVVSTDTLRDYQNNVKFAANQLAEEVNKINPDMDEIIRHANRVKAFQKKTKQVAHRTYAVEEIKKVLLSDMEANTFYTLNQLVEHVYNVYKLYVSETSRRYSEPIPNRPVHGVRYVLEELEKQGIIDHMVTEVVIEKENARPYRKKITGSRRVYFLK